MKCEILIPSYSKDVPWLEWCVKSIKKFCTGFSGITIVFPDDEQIPQIKGVRFSRYNRVKDSVKWHLHAQCQKCLADKHCPEADFILHTDSDCIFTEPITPAEYIRNGKPIMLIEEYARLKDCPWKKATEECLKFPCKYETMRRHPQVNPKGIYEDVRAHIELVHNVPFEQFMLSRKPDFPWGVSEHNLIGSFALHDPKWNNAYTWITLPNNPAPKEKLKQFWSLGALDKPQGTPHDKDTCTPIEIIKRIVG